MEEVLAHADAEDDPVSKSEEVGADQLEDDHTTQARGRKSYSIGLKLAATAKFDELGSNVARTSRELGVSRGYLQAW